MFWFIILFIFSLVVGYIFNGWIWGILASITVFYAYAVITDYRDKKYHKNNPQDNSIFHTGAGYNNNQTYYSKKYFRDLKKAKAKQATQIKNRTNAAHLYDQNIAYQVDYGDRCRVCYYYSYNESHKCAVTVRTTIKTFTVADEYGELENVDECTGCLYDGLGQMKWQCEHRHPNVTLATKCAREHYKAHQRGSCNCAYFARPIPHGLSNKTQAQLYLIKHERFNALKVGVSNNSTNDRLEEHLANGWKLVAVWKGVNGRKAYEQEQATIASWRKQGYGIAVSWKNMPQKGATETVSLAHVSKEDINTMVEDFTAKFKFKPTASL